MADLGSSHLSEAMLEAADCAIMAVDTLIRDLGLGPGHPVAVALEAQREIILSLGRLGAFMAEVGEVHNNVLDSPEMRASIQEGAKEGAEAGFKHVASEMRRRTLLHIVILLAGMSVLGGMGLRVGFTMGRNHELTTMLGVCLHPGALTPTGERACAALMSRSPR